eukprot:360627-Chlamydomonas_euryale.AAC.8
MPSTRVGVRLRGISTAIAHQLPCVAAAPRGISRTHVRRVQHGPRDHLRGVTGLRRASDRANPAAQIQQGLSGIVGGSAAAQRGGKRGGCEAPAASMSEADTMREPEIDEASELFAGAMPKEEIGALRFLKVGLRGGAGWQRGRAGWRVDLVAALPP